MLLAPHLDLPGEARTQEVHAQRLAETRLRQEQKVIRRAAYDADSGDDTRFRRQQQRIAAAARLKRRHVVRQQPPEEIVGVRAGNADEIARARGGGGRERNAQNLALV
jgi:ATPase subunit of ABC transporter with duplicated ATPase domains